MSKKLTAALERGVTVMDESMFSSIVSGTATATAMATASNRMQHGRQHELEFYEKPSHDEFLAGVTQVLGPCHAYRCHHISPDGLVYIIEEIDIWRELQKNHIIRPSSMTRTVPVRYTCNNCGHQYDVWAVKSYRDSDQRTYYRHTDHCPLCPPVSVDVWLIDMSLYPERPPDVHHAGGERKSQPTISADELVLFD